MSHGMVLLHHYVTLTADSLSCERVELPCPFSLADMHGSVYKDASVGKTTISRFRTLKEQVTHTRVGLSSRLCT
jgi:hypothetical protein